MKKVAFNCAPGSCGCGLRHVVIVYYATVWELFFSPHLGLPSNETSNEPSKEEDPE